MMIRRDKSMGVRDAESHPGSYNTLVVASPMVDPVCLYSTVVWPSDGAD